MRGVLLGLLMLLSTGTATADLTVFAASSLRESFSELGQLYEQQTGDTVHFNFAGSQTLSTQLAFGAPADLFAAAHPCYIEALIERNLAGAMHDFAANRLVVLLARREPPLRHLADLGEPGILVAVGSEAVPVGRYTRQLLASLEHDPAYGPRLVDAIRANVRSEESSDKTIVARLLLAEVDAGFVYQSDLVPAVRERTTTIELPLKHNPRVTYPATLLQNSRNREGAERFLALMLSPAGQALFKRYGFLPVADEAS